MGQNNVRFLEKLGYGSYGEVYRAKWNGKIVAAKRIHPLLVRLDPGGNNGVVAKFVAECELLRRLKHPNILEVIYIIEEPKKPPILITELLDCDLGKHFNECKTAMPLEELVVIMLGVAKGLEYLHGQDEPIIHRDICPKNILLDKSKPAFIQAKICDIGLAKILGNINKEFSPVPGTQAYMAPETYLCGPLNNLNAARYGTEIDIFSFGMTLLEGIIGEQPLPKENPLAKDEEATVHSQLHTDLEKVSECNPLRELVFQCLQDDPLERPKAENIVLTLSDPLLMKEIVKFDFQSQKRKVCEDFHQWIPVRRRTIRELEEMDLEEMTTALDEFHRKANIATAAGATTSVVATGLVIGGFISSFFTFGATIPVMVTGGAIAAAGGLTTFGAKISEIIKSKNNIKKVEDAIAEDKEESENLRKNIEKLDKLIERNVKRIFDNNEDLEDDIVNSPPDAILNVLTHFEEITGMKIMESEQLHPVKSSARAIGAVLAVTSSGVTAGTASARVGAAVFDTLSVASRATHVAGFVASVLSLPIDAYFLVNSVRELRNRSPSEVAEKIRNIQGRMVCPLEREILSLMEEYVKSKVADAVKARLEKKSKEEFDMVDDIDDIDIDTLVAHDELSRPPGILRFDCTQ